MENVAFHELLEAAPDGLMVVGTGGTILFVNRQAERIFGYARAELLGQAAETLVPERYREAHRAHRTAFSNEPGARSMGPGMTFRALRKNTSEFDAEISLSSVESPEGTRVIVAVRDVSERMRQEQMRQEQFARLREGLVRRMAQRQRTNGDASDGSKRVFRWRALELDPIRRHVSLAGNTLSLRRLEYRLIATFLEYPETTFTRDELLNLVWGLAADRKKKRTVDTHVRRLRERLGEHARAIETVHGVGYRLRAANE
jgi:PAS domain S-box-containing protein